MTLAYVTFGSLNILSADMLLEPGPAPSVCVAVAEAVDVPPTVADLTFINDGVSVAVFENASMDFASLRIDKGIDGGFYYRARILDKRWKWSQRHVSGEYNKRLPNGEFDLKYDETGNPTNEDSVKKSAYELVEALLQHVGESYFEIEDVPSDVYPHVNWDMTESGEALQEVCRNVACHICLGADGVVRVVAFDTPTNEPNEYGISTEFYYYRSDVPARIRVVGAPTLVQHHYWCRPMGLDENGDIKDRDRLSYYADSSNAPDLPYSWYHLKPSLRGLALHTMSRWWRPYKIANGLGSTSWMDVEGQGISTEWSDINQIEMLSHCVGDPQTCLMNNSGTGSVSDGHKRGRPPYLSFAEGVYQYSYNPDVSVLGFPDDVLVKSWIPVQADTYNKLLQLPVPLADDEIVCVFAHHVKDPNTRSLLRFTKSIDVGGQGEEKVIWDESLRRVVMGDWQGGEYVVTSNEPAVQEEADKVLEAAARKYGKPLREQEFGGFLAISPNASVKSVHWSMMIGEPAYTHVEYVPQ